MCTARRIIKCVFSINILNCYESGFFFWVLLGSDCLKFFTHGNKLASWCDKSWNIVFVANSDQIKLADCSVKVLINFGLFSVTVNDTYSPSSKLLSEVGLLSLLKNFVSCSSPLVLLRPVIEGRWLVYSQHGNSKHLINLCTFGVLWTRSFKAHYKFLHLKLVEIKWVWFFWNLPTRRWCGVNK